LVAKKSRLAWRIVLLAIVTGFVGACASESPHEPTLDELMRKPEFQQCLLDSGIQPRRVGECLASNPDDESARACIQAHLGEKYGPRSQALYRCYRLQPQIQTQASPPPGSVNCYRGRPDGSDLQLAILAKRSVISNDAADSLLTPLTSPLTAAANVAYRTSRAS
jgi:hypothetical protein